VGGVIELVLSYCGGKLLPVFIVGLWDEQVGSLTVVIATFEIGRQ
jgi:hypothetical protein